MADLGCSPNAAVAYDFLISKGLRDFQAAAVVGNLQQESQLDPTALASSEGAHGIAQWRNDRWAALLGFAASRGRSEWDIGLQLEFLWHELETNPSLGLQELRASTTIEEAVTAFQDRFERCGVCATPSRVSYANAALFACPGLQPPTPAMKSRKISGFAVTMGVLALVASAGYGAYEVREKWGRT